MQNPSVLAITAAALGAGLLAAGGCGSSSNGGNGGGYPAASSSAATTPASATGAASGGSTSAASSSTSTTTVATAHTSLGTILVAGPKHMTVYLFEADKGSKSSCSGPCAQAWPPVTTTGTPQAAAGTHAADLGTTTRSDGTKQLTYKGHPLYYYTSDQSSGETTGEGVKSFGAAWYVLNPNGKKVDNS